MKPAVRAVILGLGLLCTSCDAWGVIEIESAALQANIPLPYTGGKIRLAGKPEEAWRRLADIRNPDWSVSWRALTREEAAELESFVESERARGHFRATLELFAFVPYLLWPVIVFCAATGSFMPRLERGTDIVLRIALPAAATALMFWASHRGYVNSLGW